MKRKTIITVYIIILSLFISALSVACQTGKDNGEYLRIHVRANSNSETDQSVKYYIKDEIVNYLTPLVAEMTSKEKAQAVLEENLNNITEIADRILREKGFDYTAKTHINNEKFPTRVYENLTLNEGYYDALIVELGSGKGDNWWCVVYPPLCFTGGNDIVYKSKIYEIIDKFFRR